MIVKTTKDLLVESFRELAERQSIHKITIRDITDNCKLSPATFYRYFQNKFDLITWDYGNRMKEIMTLACDEGKSWSQLQLEYIRFYESHKSFFVNIIQHTRGYESFTRNMADIGAQQIRYYLLEGRGLPRLDADMELYIRIYCHGATMTVCEWLFDAIDATAEKLAVLLDNSLPLPLRESILGERHGQKPLSNTHS